MDIREPFNPITRHLLVNNAGGGGIWGRGGPVIGANGRVYGATGDGRWEPSRGFYGSSIVAASINDLRLVDYYTPRNWKDINDYDWDISCSSPVWFANQNYQLLAVGGKEGVVYLMDADSLGSKDHHSPLYITPRLANDEDTFEGKGVWGALSAWTDLNGESWVYVPIWGPASSKAPKFPVSNGDAPHGQIMAFKVVLDTVSHKPKLEPQWKSGDLNVPDPPVIANGVLFVLSTGENVQQTKEGGVIKWNKLTLLTDAERQGRTQRAKLYALDAKTGKTLWDSEELMDTWVHFSGLAVANSRIYAVDHNSQVYSFGLKEKAN
jgi:outer membrane protein assembly factor BamB